MQTEEKGDADTYLLQDVLSGRQKTEAHDL